MAKVIIPEEKMARYIQWCQKKNNETERPACCCPECGKIVSEGPLFPYFYDDENNDVYFASVCPECGALMISGE